VLLSHNIHFSGTRLSGACTHEEPPLARLIRYSWSSLNLDQIWMTAHRTPSVYMFFWRPRVNLLNIVCSLKLLSCSSSIRATHFCCLVPAHSILHFTYKIKRGGGWPGMQSTLMGLRAHLGGKPNWGCCYSVLYWLWSYEHLVFLHGYCWSIGSTYMPGQAVCRWTAQTSVLPCDFVAWYVWFQHRPLTCRH